MICSENTFFGFRFSDIISEEGARGGRNSLSLFLETDMHVFANQHLGPDPKPCEVNWSLSMEFNELWVRPLQSYFILNNLNGFHTRFREGGRIGIA